MEHIASGLLALLHLLRPLACTTGSEDYGGLSTVFTSEISTSAILAMHTAKSLVLTYSFSSRAACLFIQAFFKIAIICHPFGY